MFLTSIDYKTIPPLSSELKLLRPSILKKIQEKGGSYEFCARMYENDEKMGSLFIAECFEQCHNSSALAHWGPALVMDIVHFRLELIRYELKQVNNRLNNLFS